jgi:hypothetical protein
MTIISLLYNQSNLSPDFAYQEHILLYFVILSSPNVFFNWQRLSRFGQICGTVGSVVMKMVNKISIAAIALLSLALIAAPAFAQIGCGLGGCGIGGYGGLGYGGFGGLGYGGYGGLGYGAGLGGACSPCGGAVAVGAPQDCIAQISCNVPVTTQVPVMTCTQVPQEVPIVVPVQSCTQVTVPRVVCVPETVNVPYMTCAPSTTTVPVTVPVQSSVPVTSLVPQCYTTPVASGGCGGLDLGLPGPGR